MAYTTLVIGESGTGKTASLRNLNPDDVLLIQPFDKPLPFESAAWKPISANGGSIYVTDQSAQICKCFSRAISIGKQIVVIDDFQYLMCNEFMRRCNERGYDKFTEIARHAWDVLCAAMDANNKLRVYILSHSTQDDGPVRIKTIGRLLDEKITIEGMVTIVLRTVIDDGAYMFATRNSGNDTVKSPMGMFVDDWVPNDLSMIDKNICDYYHLDEIVT